MKHLTINTKQSRFFSHNSHNSHNSHTSHSSHPSHKHLVWLSLLLLTLPFLFSQCAAEQKSASHDTTHEGEARGVVKLNAAEQKEFGIRTATAGPATIHEEILLTGEIIIDPHRIAHMKPRFSGIVTAVYKFIGDPVKKGEVLAVIESNESLSKYKLTSAINGTIIAMHMTVGENIDDETHIITVADLSLVWANFTIYQKDLPQVKIGQSAFIKASGETVEFPGRIAYISPIVDEKTRTASARVDLLNKERHWKPGMFVTARLWVSETPVKLAVAKNALLLMNDQTVVFVQEPDGFFPHPVTLGQSNGDTVEILSGLTAGQVYVVAGGFMIKAEIQKNAFGDAHNH